MSKSNYYGRLWEYLLLISPPEEIKHSIGQIKKEVGIKYGSRHAMNSQAHISLVRFLLIKGYERSLLAQLFSFFINKVPLEIILRDFDVFPRHTLYIKVREDEALKRLQCSLAGLLTGSAGGACVKQSKNYFMTVARNLNPLQFESVSREYKSRKIDTSFQAKNVVLLKREYTEYNSYSSRWYGSHNFVMGY